MTPKIKENLSLFDCEGRTNDLVFNPRLGTNHAKCASTNVELEEKPKCHLANSDNFSCSDKIQNETLAGISLVGSSHFNSNDDSVDSAGVEGNSNKILLEQPINISIKNESNTDTNTILNVNLARHVPKITSIERTNIDIANVITSNQITANQDPDNDLVKLENGVEDKSIPASNVKYFPRLSTSVQKLKTEPSEIKEDKKSTSPKDLPPQISNKVAKPSNLGFKRTFVRKHMTGGKQYEKFSFSAIKKQIKANSSDTVGADVNVTNVTKKSSDENCTRAAQDSVSNCSQTTDVANPPANQNLNQVVNSATTSLLDESNLLSSDSSSVNADVNIDTVLDEFLVGNCDVPDNLSDDWLNALLS